MTRPRIRVSLALLVTAAGAAMAQSNGTIAGQVTDLSQAAAPGARVAATSVGTGVEHKTTTNAEGYYVLPSLPPGDYVVSAEAPGFKKSVSATLKLDTTATARADLVLVPADSKQVIEVTATPPALETDTSMTGGTVSGKEVEDLPLQGRNTLELALTLGGVSGEMGADEAGISYNIPSSGSGLSVGGGRTATSAILADGANATSIGYGRATVTFSPDTIQEFKVVTSTFSAQYGVTGGGVISTVSKSGTDEYHGNAFWFTRNPALTARTFGQPFASGMRRNELGATLGGPVRIPKLYNGRKRTFFFASFEPKRRRDEAAQYEHVPTAAERSGDFRNSWVGPGQTNPLLYQQMTCSAGGCNQLIPLNRPNATAVHQLFSAGDPDPSKRGHVIPQQYLDPLVQKVLGFVPLPNMPYDVQGRNYLGTSGVTGTDNRWSVKIDHNFAASNRMSVRYSDLPSRSNRYKLDRENFLAENPPTDRSLTKQVFLSDSHTVSPRVVNEFRGSYTFSDYSRTPSGDVATTNYTKEMFGLPNVTDWGYPQFLTGMLTLGAGINGLGKYIEHQYQFSDDVTMIMGRHAVTAGVDFRFMQSNVKSSGLLEACCGQYNFSANQTASGNANIPGGAGGFQFASFLLGVPNVANLAGVVVPYYYRFKTQAAFVQDDFKAARNLTLNLGMRWQYLSPRSEKFDRQASLDVDHPIPVTLASGQTTSYAFNYVYSGKGSGSRYLEPAHKLNFEPRFGFAWTPRTPWTQRNRLVIRGGYGISHVPATGVGRDPIPAFSAGTSGAWNYTQWTGTGARAQTQGKDPNYLVSLGRNVPVVRIDPVTLQIPADGLLCSGCTVRDSRLPTGTAVSFVGANASPYIQTWNLTTQSELGKRMVLSLTYMGQKGTHLPSPTININNPDPEKFATLLDQGGDPLSSVPDPFGRRDTAGNLRNTTLQDLMRPYPTAGDINVLGLTNNNSIYHAGTVSLERRFSGWMGYRFNYTWSKSIDDNSDGMADGQNQFNWGFSKVQSPANRKMNRSVSLFDSRHRFNLTANMELPFGRGRRFLSKGGALALAAGGWSVNAVSSLYSGYPFTPLLGDANGIPGANTGGLALRPNLVPGVAIRNPRWTREHANDAPYFNPQAFARPAYGQMGDAPRTMDWARGPWRPNLNLSVFRAFYPFENRRRYVQLRGEFFNAPNHTWFTMNPNSSVKIFNTAPAVSRTGLSLAGPIPYLVGSNVPVYAVGTRENIIAGTYNPNFAVLNMGNNNPGRIVQLAVKVYW